MGHLRRSQKMNKFVTLPPLKQYNLQTHGPLQSLLCGRYKCMAFYDSFIGHLYFPSPDLCHWLPAPALASVSGLQFVFLFMALNLFFLTLAINLYFPGLAPNLCFPVPVPSL